MNSDLRLSWKILLPLFVVAEALAATGIAQSPHEQILALVNAPERMLMAGFLLAHIHFLHAMSRPGWREYALTAVVGLVLFAAYFALGPSASGRALRDMAVLLGGCLGVATLAAFALRAFLAAEASRARARDLLTFTLLFYLFGCVGSFYLDLTSALHPATYDAIAFRIDATLGFQPSTLAAIAASLSPLLEGATTFAYGALFLGFIALYAMQSSGREQFPVSIVLTFLTSAIFACLVYHLCPIAGPKFMFADRFPDAMPDLASIAPQLGVVWPSARNGMPSFHLAWALFLWMNACHAGRLARAIFALLAGLTALATLTLGEHYLVDLAAGVPTAVAMQAAYSRVLPWSAPQRRNALLGGALLVLFWILAVRYGVDLFLAVPGLAWVAIAGTLAVSAAIYRPLARANLAALSAGITSRSQAGISPSSGARSEAIYIGAMFALSGFAGLMYQVLFSKALAQTYGSTSTATYTVLATYMGGMALGAWLGGRLADGRADALKLYARCEFAIGAYCLATPWIFQGIQGLYVSLATGVPPDAAALTVFRVLLGAAALSVPTVLMGMTLPILARFFETRAAALGASVALLYGANTLGAAFGALLTGYFILPVLGVLKTTFSAALLNALVAVLAFRLLRQPAAHASGAAPSAGADLNGVAGGVESRRLALAALAILTAGGMVTLALEVNYMHLLAVVAGNSTYAFSLMLFGFLVGLGAGAQGARWLLQAGASLPLALAWLEFSLAAVILGGVHLWANIPEYFSYFAYYPIVREFGAREVVRGLVCLAATIPPALAIGALFPIAIEAVARARTGSPIASLGRAAALNTAGNIVGVLAAGFVLLPTIGALRTIQLLAVLCLLLGAMALIATSMRRRAIAWLPTAVVLALLATQPASFDYTALASGANVYFAPQGYGKVIDHAESADGGLTTVGVVERPGQDRTLTLLTNGKFQGTDSEGGEMVAQIGFALAPLLHSPHRERALVIGFGTGVSARTLHAAGFRDLDIVDLSADILRLANTYFAKVNDRVLEKSGVHAHVTDGRNFLLLQDRAYDLIGMEISSIWFAGAASLYNREFYQLVKRRLQPHGVLQQWMQLHHLEPSDVLTILGSVRAEFAYVWLYDVGGQGIIVASNDPLARPIAANLAQIDATPTLASLLSVIGGSSRGLLQARLLDPAATDRLLGSLGKPASYWVSTDDNLRLEYSTPRGNALDGQKSRDRNMDLLQRAAAR